MASLKLVCVLLVCMMVAAPITNATITCGQVSGNLGQCLNYLKKGGAIPPACCNGVKALNAAAQTTPDRQKACECIKTSLAGSITGINANNALTLPGNCGANIPYKISTSTNCKNVK